MSDRLQAVLSSNISHIGYFSSDRLVVKFKNGRVYLYSGVPANVYSDFMGADSKGNFLNTRIKEIYAVKEITEDDLVFYGVPHHQQNMGKRTVRPPRDFAFEARNSYLASMF